MIPQSAFHEKARGLVWDTETVYYDDDGPYFKPADFSAALPTHLNVDALCTMLADYPDRVLVHMLRHGFVYVQEPELDMVINPHLLSLADGPHRVHDQLHRLFWAKIAFGSYDTCKCIAARKYGTECSAVP